MADTNYTSADLAAIDEALKNGTKEVWFKGRKETFRSVDELMKQRAFIQNSLNSTTRVRRATVVQSDL
jgi:hypothetical protein